MDLSEFNKYGHQFVDWITEYYRNIESYPVKSQVKPREIFNQLPDSAPEKSESIENIFKDFEKIIFPGITHWQSPNFFAYFPANTSFPSLLAEMLTSAIGAQCMKWETSPAAAELEEKVLIWLRDMLGLPKTFTGVIQDTASTSTLTAIISAREKLSGFKINENGFESFKNLRIYCSTETHSSIEKAVKIAGLGRKNLVKVEVDDLFRLNPDSLIKAIEKDISEGKIPLCMIATLGTTGSTAIDPLKEISVIAKKYNIWLHVDAAFAGSALILPEYKWMLDGIEDADSFVFNPHKWLFTNFDCSAYFVKDKGTLIQTFEIIPEYLKTLSDNKQVNNYCDWGIPLGRRFRALKLWFMLRNFGVKGLQDKIRYQIELSKKFEDKINKDEEFEILTPRTINIICFRFIPKGYKEEQLNTLNERLLHKINDTGRIYLTHTKLNGKYTLRFVTAQTNVQEKNIEDAWELIKEISKTIL